MPRQYSGSFVHTFMPSDIVVLIFCTCVFLNILALIFTVLYVGKIFSWIKQAQQKLKDLYIASAIILTFINLATFLIDALVYTHISIYSEYSAYFPYLITKLCLVVLIVTLEMAVSCFSTCKDGHGCSKAIHALALCQVMWFMHRLITVTVISIIEFVKAPAQALSTVTLLLSTIVCAILFLSFLIKQCQSDCSCKPRCSCKRDTLPAICCTFLIALCTIGLIITVTLMFIALVENGLQSAGIGGFIISLIPTTTIFVIGLYVSRKKAINDIYHDVVLPRRITNSSDDTNEIDIPSLDGDFMTQSNEYTQFVQTSLTIDTEGHENFEEQPYRRAQKIGL